MDISIIICTYNRCQSLKDTLHSLLTQDLDHGLAVELLIVDNNSSDNTKTVAEGFARTTRWDVRYIFVKTQGKSYALNRAVEEARGRFLVFTDDDIIPHRDWLSVLWRAYGDMNADCAGGRILPSWSETPHPWMLHEKIKGHIRGMWGCLDHGPHVIVADENTDDAFLFGANMAIRRSVFQQVGFFRTDIGRTGNLLTQGEETELISRMIKKKMKVVYDPKAVVRHKIRPEQMRLSYARMRKFYGGLSDARRLAQEIGKLPRWIIRGFLENGFKSLWGYLSFQRDIGLHYELLFWDYLGRFVGGLGLIFKGWGKQHV